MANTARVVISTVDFVDVGNSIAITFQNDEMGGEVSIFETAKNERSANNEFKIEWSLAATAESMYNALLTDYGWLSQVYFTIENTSINIIANDYGSSFTGSSDSSNISVVAIDEVLPIPTLNFSFQTAEVFNSCDFVRVFFEAGDRPYPFTFDYSVDGVAQQKTATVESEMWIEIERYTLTSRNVFVTDGNNDTLSQEISNVKILFTPEIQISQSFETGNTVSVIRKDNGVGITPLLYYSIDNISYSANGIFQNVPAGEQTFYTKDQYGCITSTTITVPSFRISEIYAVHNPLNFTIEKTTSPENVPCIIEVDGNSIGTFRAIPFDSFNGTNRYILFADEPIRANMPLFDDYPQPQGSLITVNNISARIKITEEETGNVIAEFVAVNAARQLGGDGAKMMNLVNNEEPDFVFVEGQPGYAYFYDNDFYREKILLTENADVTRLGITKPVEVLPHCPGDVILKYLDRNGMYRFYKFDKAYSISLEPEQIGRTQTIFESIATAQGVTKNIGYKNEKQLSVTALKVPDRHMESLQDIFVSPRVYMHVGDLGLDGRENWVLVDVEGDGVIKHPKRKFNDIRLTLTLPQEYNLTML